MSHNNLIAKIQKKYQAAGVKGFWESIVYYLMPPHPSMLPLCKEITKNQYGLEIGGPSSIFSRKGILPLYPLIAKLDNCNFARNTRWEKSLQEGLTFKYDKGRCAGRQYICEAVDLKTIPAGAYDFILSCHSIEHTANPLGAIKEWMRVLRPGGKIILIIPHAEGTFDHRRPVTDINHLIKDFRINTSERDLTHLSEVLELHDFDRDMGASDFNNFKKRAENNFEFRCLHHHVFDTNLALKMVDQINLQILGVEAVRPFHIILAVQKLVGKMTPENNAFFSPLTAWRISSPFKMDRDKKFDSNQA